MSRYSKLLDSGGDLISALCNDGYVWRTSDADANDVITAQTSFADTSPTLIVEVPANFILIPVEVCFAQAGTVGTGPLTLIVERDNIAKRSASGTSELQVNCNDRFASATKNATVYTGATGTAGYGMRLMGKQVGADVDSAEGVDTEYLWTPNGIELIGGSTSVGGSLVVYLYSTAGTGPTVYWGAKYAVVPLSDWI